MPKGVSRKFQGRFKGHSSNLHECFMEVSMVIIESLNVVSRSIHGCLKELSNMFDEALGVFQGVYMSIPKKLKGH